MLVPPANNPLNVYPILNQHFVTTTDTARMRYRLGETNRCDYATAVRISQGGFPRPFCEVEAAIVSGGISGQYFLKQRVCSLSAGK